MNQDSVYQKLREIGWRRPLNEAEQAELRAWLVAHPQAQAEMETDLILSTALAKLTDATVPSNFTARVLQAIEKDAAAAQRSAPPKSFWWTRVFLPRVAVTTILLVGGTMAYQQHLKNQQGKLASVAQEIIAAGSFSDPTVLADFEVIASLSQADEKLLALSDDLLALDK